MSENGLEIMGPVIDNSLGKLASTFVTAYQVSKSTKVALAKIDADMRQAIAQIQLKGSLAQGMIDTLSSSMQNALNQTSLSFEQKSAFIDKFTSVMLDTLDRF